jgi:hypothetical protein
MRGLAMRALWSDIGVIGSGCDLGRCVRQGARGVEEGEQMR